MGCLPGIALITGADTAARPSRFTGSESQQNRQKQTRPPGRGCVWMIQGDTGG